MSSRRTALVYLCDMREAVAAVAAFVADHDSSTFAADNVAVSAVAYQLVIIGEASRHIPDEARARYSDIDWRELGRIRNRLTHVYFHVQPSTAWRIAQRVVAELPAPLAVAIAEEERRRGLQQPPGDEGA